MMTVVVVAMNVAVVPPLQTAAAIFLLSDGW